MIIIIIICTTRTECIVKLLKSVHITNTIMSLEVELSAFCVMGIAETETRGRVDISQN